VGVHRGRLPIGRRLHGRHGPQFGGCGIVLEEATVLDGGSAPFLEVVLAAGKHPEAVVDRLHL